MTIPFTRWPEEFARRYREKGYWQDLPLTHILTDHAEKDTVAIIDGERHLTSRAFNQAVNNPPPSCRGRACVVARPRWFSSATWLSFTSPFSRFCRWVWLR